MSVVQDSPTPDIHRGANLARQLGWPAEETSTAGTISGLLDVTRSYRSPRSGFFLLRRYRAAAEQMLERRLAERIRDLEQQARDFDRV
ncbi:MAG TPA: hypothetical protein VEX36_09800 [Thermoleophilaceae bacterium]|nr:hypothetical protein [Thermoleophilaceae bacterium]